MLWTRLGTTDPPDEDFTELLEELLEAAGAHGVMLTQQREFHLTVSQTVVLRHHWIQPFTQSLRASLTTCTRFGELLLEGGGDSILFHHGTRWGGYYTINSDKRAKITMLKI